jgi:hypothetical protein
MLCRVDLVRTDVSEERSASINRLTRIGELGTTLLTNNAVVILRSLRQLLITAKVVSSSTILVTLMMNAIRSSEMSLITRATRCIIPKNGILHSHRRENLKSYIALTGCAL